jgi:hypothetical protein
MLLKELQAMQSLVTIADADVLFLNNQGNGQDFRSGYRKRA